MKKISKSKRRKTKIIFIDDDDDTKPRPRQPPSLFGEVPEINVPILKPTVVTTTLKKLPNVIQKTTKNVIDWGEWLKNADKVIEEQNEKNIKWRKWLENINKVAGPTFTQTEQALRGFTRSYEISLTNRND